MRRRDVDDRLELDSLLYGQITGPGTANDPIPMHCDAPAQLDQISRERHQATTVGKQLAPAAILQDGRPFRRADNVGTAEGDIRVLQREKRNVAEKIVLGVTA